MFADIQKSIDLEVLEYPDKTKKGAPNILIALDLSCYTEYWGKLLRGIAIGDSQKCYEEFLKRLGKSYNINPYEKLLNDGVPVYHDIRCGLVHSYAVSDDCTVYWGVGNCGICYDTSKHHYDFNVTTYFKDFKDAVSTYMKELENGIGVSNMNKAMKDKPLIG